MLVRIAWYVTIAAKVYGVLLIFQIIAKWLDSTVLSVIGHLVCGVMAIYMLGTSFSEDVHYEHPLLRVLVVGCIFGIEKMISKILFKDSINKMCNEKREEIPHNQIANQEE